MIKYAYFIPVLIMLTFSGCRKDGNGNSNETFNCFFLQVGNEWTYTHTEFANKSELKVRIESETDSVYKVSRSLGSNVPTYQYWYTEGPYLYAYLEGEIREDARVIFKCSANVGNSWESESFEVAGETDFYQITAQDQTINTFAGEFMAAKVKISYSYRAEERYQYWSDIYGLVFQEGLVSLELTGKNH